MTRAMGTRTGRATRIGIVLGVLASSLVAATASAAPVITREIEIHFSRSQHFDADPNCGSGGTEVQEGNRHLFIVDDGSWLNVTGTSTFTITVIPDDPSIAPSTRKVTSAAHFRLQTDGDALYHETFRDFGDGLKIRFMWTWVTRDGEVVVDHQIVGDQPPPGC
jgi:hypothetical protein